MKTILLCALLAAPLSAQRPTSQKRIPIVKDSTRRDTVPSKTRILISPPETVTVATPPIVIVRHDVQHDSTHDSTTVLVPSWNHWGEVAGLAAGVGIGCGLWCRHHRTRVDSVFAAAIHDTVRVVTPGLPPPPVHDTLTLYIPRLPCDTMFIPPTTPPVIPNPPVVPPENPPIVPPGPPSGPPPVTTTPEPATIGLVAIGLAVVAIAAKRKRVA